MLKDLLSRSASERMMGIQMALVIVKALQKAQCQLGALIFQKATAF
jgi:hypothetical protein